MADKIEYTSEQIGQLAGLFRPLHDRLDNVLINQSEINTNQAKINSDNAKIITEMNMRIGNTEREVRELKMDVNRHQQTCVARTRLEDHIDEHPDLIENGIEKVKSSTKEKRKDALRLFLEIFAAAGGGAVLMWAWQNFPAFLKLVGVLK